MSTCFTCLLVLPAMGSCLACNDPDCDGGLQLDVRGSADNLTAGEWTLAIVADEDAFEIMCTTAALAAESDCMVPADTGDWHVSARVRGDQLAQTGAWTGPPRSIGVTIIGGDDEASEYGGPTTTSVDVAVDGIAAAGETFEPDYDRTFHRGPEACGRCDRAEVGMVVE